MIKNKHKVAKWLFRGSLVVTLIGFFLQTVLFPVQDFNLMSQADLLELQKEFAINYPLGVILFYGGLVSLILTIVYLLTCLLKPRIKIK